MKKSSSSGKVKRRAGEPGGALFAFYCVFVVSYFLHMGDRVPILGILRIDLLLAGVILLMILMERRPAKSAAEMDLTGKLLLIICAYVILTLPFVRWPGSVVARGWQPFMKATCFYFFTLATVTTERRLKIFLAVFVSVQIFRVLEPLYLHMTTGYWGSFTNMGNYEFMDRLAGAPMDIINPNGLAFVILVSLSLLHSLLGRAGWRERLLYVVLLLPLMYAMALTGSRSGVMALVVLALLSVWKSKNKLISLAIIVGVATVLFLSLNDLERQRYISIVDHSAKGGATAQGRIDGIWADFEVGMRRPVFGHGLGTSLEANANTTGEALPSHTLYTEVLQELGLVGLGIFMAFIVATLRNCWVAYRATAGLPKGLQNRAASGLIDFSIVLAIFSIASYGLSEYQWYLIAGLSVVLCRLSAQPSAQGVAPKPAEVVNGKSGKLRKRPLARGSPGLGSAQFL